MNWFLEAMRKYATFTGRSRRKEYWFFQLFVVIGSVVLILLDETFGWLDTDTGFGPLSFVFGLAMLLPNLAVAVRRLHDTDRSGWWLLLSLIPIIGGLVLLVFFILDSTPGTNRFGENPKGVAA